MKASPAFFVVLIFYYGRANSFRPLDSTFGIQPCAHPAVIKITWRIMRFPSLGLKSGLGMLQSRETPCFLGRGAYV